MASIRNNYNIHVAVQGWRFDDAESWQFQGICMFCRGDCTFRIGYLTFCIIDLTFCIIFVMFVNIIATRFVLYVLCFVGCMYVCMYVHVCMYMHVCMYVCMHACMYAGRRSNLDQRLVGPDSKEAIPLLGKRNYRPRILTLSPVTFSQLQDLYAIHDPVYDRLRKRWVRQTRRSVPMADWVQPRAGRAFTCEEKELLRMSPEIQVHAEL